MRGRVKIPYPVKAVMKGQTSLLSLWKLPLYYFSRFILGQFRVSNLQLDIVQSNIQGLIVSQPIDSLVENHSIFNEKVFDWFYVPNADDIVIDVGAHVGLFTIKIAKKVAAVVAVEPSSLNCSLLLKNVRTFQNVFTINMALSNFVGISKLYLNNSSVGHSITEKFSKYEKVRTTTLDKLVEGLNWVNFIKINAEGSELQILKGAEKTLRENNDLTLSIATNHYSTETEEVVSFLNKHRFISLVENDYVYAFKEVN